MHEQTFLSNQFLIAMPGLHDPNFERTVTYLCEHGPQGALGIIVNRPLELSLADLFGNLGMGVPDGAKLQSLFFGGPVHPEQGFVLHRSGGHWQSSLSTGDGLSITPSRDILEAMARGEGPEEVLVALGYAGWGPGQLERELGENSWLSAPADTDVIFHRPPTERWDAAAALLGVDLRLLAPAAGHA